MARLAGIALLLITAFALIARGAQNPTPQAPVFRTGTETVAIYATVLDRSGEMVPNLRREDFDVYDDGKPQPLTVFVSGLQPITAALLVDTSASMTLNLELAQQAAEQFVIRMLPGDRVRVGSFSDRVDLSPDFTSDRDRLLKSLRDDLHIGNPTKLWDAIDQTMTSLAPLGGRRVILVLTDGMDTASRVTSDAIFQRSRVDELMIYIVQFRSTPLANQAEIPLSPTPGMLFGSPPPLTFRALDDLIRRLASQTGGGHFVMGRNDDVNATFTAVMQELHYQYTLGFTPERADGRVHELVVRVRRPGLTVRARRSYLAAPSAPAVRPQ
ncbi:MAG: VWA domain-containing protein [Acidobacteriota bacterium]